MLLVRIGARREIGVHQEIGVHRGSRALTTVAHGRPWALVGLVGQGEIVRRVVLGRRMRREDRARGRHEAKDEGTGRRRLSAPGRATLAQGQGRVHQATADVDSVPGGRTAAEMAGRTAERDVGVTIEIGPDLGAVAGTSRLCPKSRMSRLLQAHRSHRPWSTHRRHRRPSP
jgi:hypothetical protein